MSEDAPTVGGGFTAGSRIAGYLLEEQIGRGGMAVVFRAVDERLDRRVALKILAPEMAADEAFRHRFTNARGGGGRRPHIIPVFEAGEASGVPTSRALRAGRRHQVTVAGEWPVVGLADGRSCR